MMKLSQSSALAVTMLSLWAALQCVSWTAEANGADADLRVLRAQAIRRAAAQVEQSLVRVEQFGTAESVAEVADDAPTVAVAIDDQRHFIASAMVSGDKNSSLVLVGPDERRTTAKVVARDARRQIVLLEATEDVGTKPITIEQAPLAIGQTVVAVGKIAGDGSLAVASGVLSATERLWGIALQTDARVSSIFYGGALLDLQGRVLGIIVPMVPEEMGEEMTAWYDAGVAFAIPATDIQKRLPRLLQGQDIKPGVAGIVAKSNDPYVESTDIATVRTRSPAAKAGLQAGDQITAIDGVALRSHREIKQSLGAKDAGDTVTLRYRREGQESDVQLTLTDEIPPLNPQWLGITATEQSEQDKPTSVIVSGTFAGSPADGKLAAGDIVRSINDVPVDSLAGLRRVVFAADPDQKLKLAVERAQGQPANNPTTIELQTQALAAAIPTDLPDSLTFVESGPWQINEIKLPEISNQVKFVGPNPQESYESLAKSPGLLMLLADPGDQDLQKIATDWLKPAQSAGVTVCLVAPATDNRWQPDEIDNLARIASAISTRYGIADQMIAIAGIGEGPGSSMAMAVAMSRPGSFAGLIVTPASKPPAIRLRENDPAAPLQILIRQAANAEAPPWKTPLERLGYSVQEMAGEQALMLKWTRLLVRI